jgi:uncharacterized repeat protein (TIGR03803 family)
MGGTSRNGTVFSLSTNGTGFATLHNFSAFNNNTDGGNPEAGLVLSGTTLYGTAYAGGSSGNGTVFALNTDGTGFTTLYSFTALSSGTNGDGANPSGGLLLSGNTLYGTAQNGGNAGNGTVFSLTVPPPLLNIQPIGNSNVVLSWPTNFTGFTLEANTNLGSNVWSVVSPAPSVSGTNNVVTNAISGAARFYRLSQ